MARKSKSVGGVNRKVHIFDEAHLLKNFKSERSQEAGDSNFIVKVLATVQNTLEELFRLVDIA